MNTTVIKEKAKTFRDIIAWQKSHLWVIAIYGLTKTFPKDELFGLTSQLRRASVSIPANLAEGFKRRTYVEKARFYNIAQSSLEECRYYLILAHDLGYGNCDKLMSELEVVSKLLEKYYAGAKNWSENKE